jgi:U3 small nucleolar RNA-associated protein 4
MALANNSLEIFDVEARHTPGWARALTANLPKRFTHLHDAVLGVTFDPGAASGVISGTISGGAPGASTSTGVVPSTLKPRHALFWGSTWICKVQLDAPVGWGGFSKKRRRNAPRPVDGPSINTNGPMVNGINGVHTNGNIVGSNPNVDADSGNFKLVTHYRPILFVDFIGPGELVVVERPVVDVMSGLPPAFWKPKYGAS